MPYVNCPFSPSAATAEAVTEFDKGINALRLEGNNDAKSILQDDPALVEVQREKAIFRKPSWLNTSIPLMRAPDSMTMLGAYTS